jgi:hypothetical protein
MTVSFMRCFSSVRLKVCAWAYLLALATAFFPAFAKAEGIQVNNAEVTLIEDTYRLDAVFNVGLNKALEEALQKGVTLSFLYEVDMVYPRWYWLDETIVSYKNTIRLSYHALTRQYLLTGPHIHKSFATLTEARQELGFIRSMPLVDRNVLKKNTVYQVELRMKLDLNQLPKPLQVDALGSRDWNLSSDWHTITVVSP